MHKITATDPESHSADLLAANIAKLKELFPEVVAEGKVDFNALQEILGNEVESGEEFYRFTWAGKAQARREAHKPSTGTLRPCPEESVEWASTKNLYIQGDNMEVLKLLQKSYGGKVKMIYIDPPYNTGKDFVYKDNYHDNLRNYKELTGQVDSEGNTLSTNSDTDGRYHSNWLNMIYPRLRLARNLLSDDGLLFVSIDDNERDNLAKVLSEVFGQDAYLNCFTVVNNLKGRQIAGMGAAKTYESLLVYVKSADAGYEFAVDVDAVSKQMPAVYKKGAYALQHDDIGPYVVKNELYNTNSAFNEVTRPNLVYTILLDPVTGAISFCRPNEASAEGLVRFDPHTNNKKGYKYHAWRWGRDKVMAEHHDLYFDIEGKRIFTKIREYEATTLKDLILGLPPNGNKAVEELFGFVPFEFSKAPELIKLMLSVVSKDGLIMDFFSGSATTADSVMQLNAEDGGQRQHIQVQLPEPTDAKSEANKADYTTIAEIGKERIRRAGKKIVEELEAAIKALEARAVRSEEEEQELKEKKERLAKLDIGFRVFKLDSSNIAAWDGDPERMQENLLSAAENIKPDRTEADVLYEVLLKYGLDLTLPIEERSIAKCTVYNVGMGALFLCLAECITNAVAEGIGQWKDELKPETCRVIFRDNGFTDVEKTNAMQTLKRYGVTEVRSV